MFRLAADAVVDRVDVEIVNGLLISCLPAASSLAHAPYKRRRKEAPCGGVPRFPRPPNSMVHEKLGQQCDLPVSCPTCADPIAEKCPCDFMQ